MSARPMPAARARQLLVLMLLAAAGCGPAIESDGSATRPGAGPGEPDQPAPSPPAGASALPISGEVLLADPPAGWVESGTLTSPVLRMAEYVPADQVEPPDGSDAGAEDPARPPAAAPAAAPEEATQEAPSPRTPQGRDRVTFEAHAGRPLPDPIDFVLALGRDLAQRCEGFTEFNIMSGMENNYATSVRLMICPRYRDRQDGEVLMIKAIRGREYFYTVTRGRRLSAFAPEAQVLSPATMAAWSTYLKAIGVCDPRAQEHPCPPRIETEGAAS